MLQFISEARLVVKGLLPYCKGFVTELRKVCLLFYNVVVIRKNEGTNVGALRNESYSLIYSYKTSDLISLIYDFILGKKQKKASIFMKAFFYLDQEILIFN